MKRCPECRRDYYDETMNFCLDDGAALRNDDVSHLDTTAIFTGTPSGDKSADPVTLVLRNARPETAVPNNSVAVLPFVNMSADADNEYFCDGLAEEVMNALTKIDDLKVAARTAAFSFRGKNVPMGEIGRTLNVSTILEGSVRKAGNHVRITIQLINVADGYHLWSGRYDRDMQDIFEIQDEITLAVVDALKVKLLAPEKRAVLKRHTNDAEAYQLYLRGRFFFYKRTPEGFLKAIECFEKAIAIDEEYAVAISGLADSYVFLGFYEMISPGEAASKVRSLVKMAFGIDDTLTETNTSFALMKTLYDWEHRDSLEFFQRAIDSDPKYPLAYHLQSAVFTVLGEHQRAFAAEERAIELDPFTPIYNASLAWWYYIGGRNDAAIAQAKRTIEIAPSHFFAYWVLGLTYAIEGSYAESVVAFQQSVALNQFEAHVRADLARVFAIMGERETAMDILADLERLSTSKYVSAANIAKVYVGLGEDEKVIEQLGKACEERAVRLSWLLVDPILKHLHSDTRYQEIRRRAGLPDAN